MSVIRLECNSCLLSHSLSLSFLRALAWFTVSAIRRECNSLCVECNLCVGLLGRRQQDERERERTRALTAIASGQHSREWKREREGLPGTAFAFHEGTLALTQFENTRLGARVQNCPIALGRGQRLLGQLQKPLVFSKGRQGERGTEIERLVIPTKPGQQTVQRFDSGLASGGDLATANWRRSQIGKLSLHASTHRDSC